MPRQAVLKFAVITDIHYGINTGNKLGAKGPQVMNAFERAVKKKHNDFIIDMGDRISTREIAQDRAHMENLMTHFNRMAQPVYHVMGNHDVQRLSRADNAHITGQGAESYSLDHSGYHLVIWNPYVDREGTGLRVRPQDLDWLRDDLHTHDRPTIIFSHAPLYQEKNPHDPEPGYKPAIRFHFDESEKIREILEQSRHVRLCMNGHLHRNHHETINGIHYIAQQSATQAIKTKPHLPTRAWSWVEATADRITVKLQGHVRKDYVLDF
ncbi:MAG TPA: metallophosphoesterase [Micavibrio sp.]